MEQEQKPAFRPRYTALYAIPDDIEFIQMKIDEAAGKRHHGRGWEKLVVAAGGRALDMQTRVTDSPPLWLALQRQIMVRDWSFKDLEQLQDPRLNDLDMRVAIPFTETLTNLRVRRRSDQQAQTKLAARALVEDAWHEFANVQAMAIQASRASGRDLPDGSESVRIIDSMIVDHAQGRMEELRDALAIAVNRAQNKEANEAELQRIIGLCAAVITAVASVTATIAQIPDAWNEIEHLAENLSRLLADLHVAPTSGAAMLGLVIAVRRSDDMLGFTGGPDAAGSPVVASAPAGGPDAISTASQDQRENFGDKVAKAIQLNEDPSAAGETQRQAQSILRGAFDAGKVRNIDDEDGPSAAPNLGGIV